MGDRLRVALDATPLIGRPTGVGAFCYGVLDGLSRRKDVAATAFAVSWRRRHAIDGRVPRGVGIATRAMPARPLHASWSRTELPPIEWFVGEADVVHGTNYVVPPTRWAARVVTVHDLTTVRYPELCDPATLAFPALVRRALAHGAWVHTHSASVAEEVVDVFGADPARVRPVASGVPALASPEPDAAARFLAPGVKRYVLAVGTAEPRKDLPGLVSAFDMLAGERPDLGLLLAGPEGWGSGALARAPRPARGHASCSPDGSATRRSPVSSRGPSSSRIPRCTKDSAIRRSRPWQPGRRWSRRAPAPSPRCWTTPPSSSLPATRMRSPPRSHRSSTPTRSPQPSVRGGSRTRRRSTGTSA